VNFSKLKSDAYEVLGLIIPGMILLGEGWITLRGWRAFVSTTMMMTAPTLTIFLLLAFGLGHLLQELSDVLVNRLTHPRFSKAPRDTYWVSQEGAMLRATIKKELGEELPTVDAAFDYCLTKAQAGFAKRDVFVATADLSRAFFTLSILALIPGVRLILLGWQDWRPRLCAGGLVALGLALIARLSWRRMVRFREYSETPVFRAYLAGGKASPHGAESL